MAFIIDCIAGFIFIISVFLIYVLFFKDFMYYKHYRRIKTISYIKLFLWNHFSLLLFLYCMHFTHCSKNIKIYLFCKMLLNGLLKVSPNSLPPKVNWGVLLCVLQAHWYSSRMFTEILSRMSAKSEGVGHIYPFI